MAPGMTNAPFARRRWWDDLRDWESACKRALQSRARSSTGSPLEGLLVKLSNPLCEKMFRYGWPKKQTPVFCLCWLHSQVQQRGIGATVSILKHLLSGMNVMESQPLLIVDLLPSRIGWMFWFFDIYLPLALIRFNLTAKLFTSLTLEVFRVGSGRLGNATCPMGC